MKAKKVFQFITNSNSAPFFSDTDDGFVKADDAMSALKDVVKNYKHPCGLFSAVICEPSPKNPVLARYLSARSATAKSAPSGLTEWREDGLYVNDKRVPDKQEIYELVKRRK